MRDERQERSMQQQDDTRGDGERRAAGPAGSTAASNEVVPTDAECSVLRHMLGIDKPEEQHPKAYRDYFCANPDDPQLMAMECRRLVECYSSHGGYVWYRCTDAGRAAAFRSHKATRYPKSKRVYLRFLRISDAYPDLTFKEFLSSKRFAEARRDA